MNYEHLRILALHGVFKETNEYVLRKVQRWYSKNYATPLWEVENLPVDHVLTTYYESIYEEMEAADLQDAVDKELMSEDQRLEFERKKDKEEVEAAEFAKFSEMSQKKLPEPPPKTEKSLKQEMDEFLGKLKPEPVVSPDISITFEAEELDDDDAPSIS